MFILSRDKMKVTKQHFVGGGVTNTTLSHIILTANNKINKLIIILFYSKLYYMLQ